MTTIIARRRLLAALAGAAAWPIAARAQQDQRVRLIGWLDGYDESIESQALRTALRDGLVKLGWIESRNLKIERRFGVGDANRMQASAAELVSRAPDVIVAGGAAPARALQHATQTIPIVFTGGGDAFVIGLVKNIAHPEGNATGFSSGEPTIAGKWLELLKEAVPSVARVAIVFNPEIAPTSPKYIATIETAARTLSMQTVKAPFRDAIELCAFDRRFCGGAEWWPADTAATAHPRALNDPQARVPAPPACDLFPAGSRRRRRPDHL